MSFQPLSLVRRVSPLLQSLLGLNVIASNSAVLLSFDSRYLIATYSDRYQVERYVILWEVSLANSLAAAALLESPQRANNFTQSAKIPAEYRASLRDIALACSALFVDSDVDRANFKRLIFLDEPLDVILAARLKHPAQQLCLTIDTERCSGGRMMVLTI